MFGKKRPVLSSLAFNMTPGRRSKSNSSFALSPPRILYPSRQSTTSLVPLTKLEVPSAKNKQTKRRNGSLSELALKTIMPIQSVTTFNYNAGDDAGEGNFSHLDAGLGDIPVLIETIEKHTTYIYTCEQKPKSSLVDALQAIDSLANMWEENSKNFKATDLKRLLQMVKTHIIHSFPDVSKILVPGEPVAPYFVDNWSRLTHIYKLFHVMLGSIVCIIDDKSIEEIMSMLSTPCQGEQEHVISILRDMALSGEELKVKIAQIAMNRLSVYKDGNVSSLSVTPLISILVEYFESLEMPINTGYFQLFRSSLYTLITSHDCVRFYQQFCNLARFFYSKDSTTAMWCIRYIFRHWPVTDSFKQVVFMHQCQSLLCCLSGSFLPVLAEGLCSKLRVSVESVNHRVATTAISFCSDEKFMTSFMAIAGNVAVSLIPCIDRAKSHWHWEVRKLAEEAASLMKRTKTGKIKTADSRRSQKGWLSVATMAHAADKTIDLQRLKEQICADLTVIDGI